jgi:hypothetical protein
MKASLLRHAAQAVAATCMAGAMLIGVSAAASASTSRAEGPRAAAAAKTASAVTAPSILRGAGINCGYITCTFYIYRGTTRAIDGFVSRYANASTATVAGGFAIACSPIGGVGAVVCGAVGAIWGGYAIDQFNYAASHNQCIAIKYNRIGPPTVLGFGPNNSGYCHN